MRSLRYILKGRCHTLDDCLDHSKMEPPTEVCVRLRIEEVATDLLLFSQFVATFLWRYGEETVEIERVYGSFRIEDDPLRRSQEAEEANRRLFHDLDRIRQRNFTVNGPENDYKSMLPKGQMTGRP